MKEGKNKINIILSISLILFLSISFVSANAFTDWFKDLFTIGEDSDLEGSLATQHLDGKTTRKKTTTQTCTDTDGGINISMRGVASNNGNSVGESCISITNWDIGYNVLESSCNGTKIIQEEYPCPLMCRDGACINEIRNLSCVDSDGEGEFNQNNFIKGNVKVYFGNELLGQEEDECVGSNVIEKYCSTSSYFIVGVEIDCLNGCKNGACIPINQTTCTDSDGGLDYNTPGISTGIYSGGIESMHFIFGTPDHQYGIQQINGSGISIIYDYCQTETQVNEGFCQPDGRMGMGQTNCLLQGKNCSNGACVNPPITTNCTDTDVTPQYPNGLNYGEKGTISPLGYTDSCSITIANRLIEYTCTLNQYGHPYEFYMCPNECLNGACVGQIGCSADSECSSGYSCANGECISQGQMTIDISPDSLLLNTCNNTDVSISGIAEYLVNGFRSVVLGATVNINLVEQPVDSTTTYTTSPNGTYSQILLAPGTPGNYTIKVDITDGSVSGSNTEGKLSVLDCDSEPTCTSNDYTSCFNNNLYWYDSCDNLGSMRQSCEFGCEVGSQVCNAGPEPCELTNAYWNQEEVDEGTIVELIVEGTNCEGRTIEFEIWEDDGVFANDYIVQLEGVYDRGTWNTKYVEDQFGGPEYFFIARIDGGNTKPISSGNLDVNEGSAPYCGDGTCQSDALYKINEGLTMGVTDYDGSIRQVTIIVQDTNTASIIVDGETKSVDEGWAGTINGLLIYVKNVVGPNVAGAERYVELIVGENQYTCSIDCGAPTNVTAYCGDGTCEDEINLVLINVGETYSINYKEMSYEVTLANIIDSPDPLANIIVNGVVSSVLTGQTKTITGLTLYVSSMHSSGNNTGYINLVYGENKNTCPEDCPGGPVNPPNAPPAIVAIVNISDVFKNGMEIAASSTPGDVRPIANDYVYAKVTFIVEDPDQISGDDLPGAGGDVISVGTNIELDLTSPVNGVKCSAGNCTVNSAVDGDYPIGHSAACVPTLCTGGLNHYCNGNVGSNYNSQVQYDCYIRMNYWDEPTWNFGGSPTDLWTITVRIVDSTGGSDVVSSGDTNHKNLGWDFNNYDCVSASTCDYINYIDIN